MSVRDSAILMLALLFQLLLPTPTSHAANANCGTSLINFDTMRYNPLPSEFKIRGARADVQVEPADLCTSTTLSDSVAWSMLHSDDGTGWAQIGYIHKAYGDVAWRFFWQWQKNENTSEQTAYFGDPVWNTTKNFKVSRKIEDGKVRMYINDAVAPPNQYGDSAITSFDPLQAWNGMQARWGAETRYGGSDVPGTFGDRADFFDVNVKNENDDWRAKDLQKVPIDCAWHNRSVVSWSNFEIWTAPLDHGTNCG